MTRPDFDLNQLEALDLLQGSLAVILGTNVPPRVFQRASRLIRLYDDGPDSTPRAEEHGVSSLRVRLSEVADWSRVSNTGNRTPQLPPRDLAAMLLSLGEYPGVPELERVVDAPVYLESEDLLTDDGYSELGRVYLRKTPSLSRGKVRASLMEEWEAVEVLDEMIGDFPIETPSDRAHAFALMLTPLVRDMIAGPTPLFLATSAKAGMGKTLLAQACLYPTCGHVPLTLVPRSEEELAKAMVGLLRTGAPAIVLDNLGHELDAPSLAQAITARIWQSRILGRSEIARFRVRNAWVMTANNPSLSYELRRRTVPIYLEALEHPETRTFQHGDLMGWLEKHRFHVFMALVTLVEAVKANEGASWGGPILPSFESWSYLMGAILANAGVEGFLENLDRLDEADSESDTLLATLKAIHSVIGSRWFSVTELRSLALIHPSLQAVVGDFRTNMSLAKALGKMKHVPASGFLLQWKPGYWLVEGPAA